MKDPPVIPQASLPVQEYLFMPFDQAHKQYETARHLPPPLYVLFVQASAYGQACGEHWGIDAPTGQISLLPAEITPFWGSFPTVCSAVRFC